MYLTLSQRILCYAVVIPALFVGTMLVIVLSGNPGTDNTGIYSTLFIFLAILAWPLGALLTYFFSEGSTRRYQPDFLKEELGVVLVAELRGVQWSLLMFPDRIAAPGVAVATFFLQNAHGSPRVVTVGLQGNPFQVGGGKTHRHQLEGGEVAVLRFPLLVPAGARPARHELLFSVEVRRAGRIGPRVISRDGRHPRRLGYSLRAELEVLGGHAGATVNQPALGWAAYQRLFIPGQGEPDLEPVRLLESL